jgi:hypothetical protein
MVRLWSAGVLRLEMKGNPLGPMAKIQVASNGYLIELTIDKIGAEGGICQVPLILLGFWPL